MKDVFPDKLMANIITLNNRKIYNSINLCTTLHNKHNKLTLIWSPLMTLGQKIFK